MICKNIEMHNDPKELDRFFNLKIHKLGYNKHQLGTSQLNSFVTTGVSYMQLG